MNRSDLFNPHASSCFAPTVEEVNTDGLTLYPKPDIRCEISEDYVLPESYPDMKKLLWVKVTPHVTDHSYEGGVLHYTVSCDLSLLYVSDTNRLRSGQYTITVNGREPIGLSGEGIDAMIPIPLIEKNDCKMLSPRKMAFRLSLLLSPCMLVPVKLSCLGCEEESLQLDRTTVESMKVHIAEQMGLDFHEDLELENNQSTIGELLQISIDPIKANASMQESSVEVSGDILVRCMYESDQGQPKLITKRYTIREQVEMPKANPTMRAMAILEPQAVSASVQCNAYGEKRILEIDAAIGAKIWAYENSSVHLVSDAYSTRYQIIAQTKKASLFRLAGTVSTAFSVNLSTERKDAGAENVGSVFDGDLILKEITVRYDEEKRKYILEGKAYPIYLTERLREEEGGGREYSVVSSKSPVPVRGEIEARDQIGTIMMSVIQIQSLRFRSDENRLSCDFEVSVTLPIAAQSDITCLSQIDLNEDAPHKKAGDGICMYYPNQTDTLWSIAKQYAIPQSWIAEENNLSPSGPAAKKVLLIPRRK